VIIYPVFVDTSHGLFSRSLLLALWILSMMISRSWRSVHKALGPLCSQPLLPLILPAYICTTDQPGGSPDYPAFLHLQSRFEKILADSAVDPGLALNLKRSEAAVKDLTVLVRLSKLSGKEDLADRLGEVSSDAKVAGRDLHKLAAKVAGAVDRCVSLDFR
jgi:hypothetical protein